MSQTPKGWNPAFAALIDFLVLCFAVSLFYFTPRNSCGQILGGIKERALFTFSLSVMSFVVAYFSTQFTFWAALGVSLLLAAAFLIFTAPFFC
ncbi:hypothetical protein F8S09_10260 [Deinococcus sp. SDU3-2]|uniref:Uncharacterized protein n=1 Tax=Deinococcus terrestris TaxID=2651870 RepID=A0A7X1NX35_9DEIO|nr:hypothetical protein [Deinococcus terrestris]MPY67069.1 hypothetical protein [Deinococcus terrestris]